MCSPWGRVEHGDLGDHQVFSVAAPGAGGTWGDRRDYKWHYNINFILMVMRKHWLVIFLRGAGTAQD